MCIERIPALMLTGDCGFPVDGGNELGRGFFNQHVRKRESQVRLFFTSKAKREDEASNGFVRKDRTRLCC